MIKENFLFVWSRKKAFLFFCAALLARSRNRQQNRCILCVASLKHTAAGQSRPICCTICKGKQNCWRHQARFLKKIPLVSWHFHCFFSKFLLFEFTCNSFNNCVTTLLSVCTTQIYWIKCIQTYPYLKVPFRVKGVKQAEQSRAKHTYPCLPLGVLLQWKLCFRVLNCYLINRFISMYVYSVYSSLHSTCWQGTFHLKNIS